MTDLPSDAACAAAAELVTYLESREIWVKPKAGVTEIEAKHAVLNYAQGYRCAVAELLKLATFTTPDDASELTA